MTENLFDKALSWANDNQNKAKSQRNSSITKFIIITAVIIIVIIVIWLFKTSDGKKKKSLINSPLSSSITSAPDKYLFVEDITNKIVPLEEVLSGNYQLIQ